MKWIVLHQMESQDKPEAVCAIDVDDDQDTMDLDDLAAELRMRPNVSPPSMAPGDTLHLLDEEDYEFKKSHGEVVGEIA